MQLYAHTPARFSRQVLADVSVAAWTAAWVWVAVTVHQQVNRLATPGQRLEAAGNGLTDRLGDAGDAASGVPLVGGKLRSAFTQAGSAGTDLADAGRAQQDAVHHVALMLALVSVVVPVGLVLLVWLFLRLRWSREATAARRLWTAHGDADLFALRALTHQPLARLARVSGDPAAAWRRGDADVVARLAEIELRSLGLRASPPRAVPATTSPA